MENTEPRTNAAQRPKVRLYLEGRYRKLVRNLPQTIFYCPKCKGRRKGCARCNGYGKLTKDSVQELIARKVLPRYRARNGRFHGAGREDVNVRMLGTGRPFIFEVVYPRNLIVDLDELVDAVNGYGEGRVQITQLLPVQKRRVAQLKEASSDKVYRALVRLESDEATKRAVELVGGKFEVAQRTPKRVAHRRADRERSRCVEILSVEIVNDVDRAASMGGSTQHPRTAEPCISLEVRCEHGTYVKEWISGENGRTKPSFAELVASRTDCLALDVWDVIGPFPPLEGKVAPCFANELSWPLPESPDPWALGQEQLSLPTQPETM